MAPLKTHTSLCTLLVQRAALSHSGVVAQLAEWSAALTAAQERYTAAEASCVALLAHYGFPVIAPLPALEPIPTPASTAAPQRSNCNTLQTAISHLATAFLRHSSVVQHNAECQHIKRQIAQLDARGALLAQVESHLRTHADDPTLLASVAAFTHTSCENPAHALMAVLQTVHRGGVPDHSLRDHLTNTAQVLPHPSLAQYVVDRVTLLPGMVDLVTALGWIVIHTPSTADITALISTLDALEFTHTPLLEQPYGTNGHSLAPAFAVPSATGLSYTGFDAVQNAQQQYRRAELQLEVTAKYLPKTSKAENNLPGEDTLLFDVRDDAALAIVSDGVSQSAYGYHAAQQLTLAFYRVWKVQSNISPTATDYWERLLVPALALASIVTEACVAHDMAAQNGFMRSVIQEGYDQTGSQAIFAVVVSTDTHIACIWMGNTRIMMSATPPLPTIASLHRSESMTGYFGPDDVDFADDRHRFSSQARVTPTHRGMRNTAFVHLLDVRDAEAVRIMIHSDALEPYAAQLAATTLDAPLPLTFMNMREAAKRDDATVLDIIMTRVHTQNGEDA